MSILDPAIDFGVMPRIAAPSDPSDAQQTLAYRKAIARRNLRAEVGRSLDGTYHNGNMCNLIEVLGHFIVEGADPWRNSIDVAVAVQTLAVQRGLPPFTDHQRNHFFSEVTQAQLDTLIDAIAASSVGIMPTTYRETTSEHRDSREQGRDCAIRHLAWEHAAGMHNDPLNVLTIGNVVDVAALDDALCTRSFAAIEQQLQDKNTGDYAYVPNADGTFTVRAFIPENVPAVRALLSEFGATIVSEQTLPLNAKQLERNGRPPLHHR